MMVKWANDALLQANDDKMLVNDGQMLVNDGEMSVWSYIHFSILTSILPSLTSILPSSKLTIIRSFDHHWEDALTEIGVTILSNGWSGEKTKNYKGPWKKPN